ncbi:MAG: hypothetical protein CSA74_02905 [Rhodobacterales bacterium]|nr:MAG: hypothetical protein CSA74_02905 [Rhodobacterales bacterium]
MNSNVIAFARRNTRPDARARQRQEQHDNIVNISSWLERARPRRTPTGVFFTTGVLATTGFSA